MSLERRQSIKTETEELKAQQWRGVRMMWRKLPNTDISCPACIASGNFILEFPSINSRSRLFSRWRMRARSVEQMTSLAGRACVNVRIGEFMLGNSRTKLPVQCMLGRRGEFEEVAFRNAQSASSLFIYRSLLRMILVFRYRVLPNISHYWVVLGTRQYFHWLSYPSRQIY